MTEVASFHNCSNITLKKTTVTTSKQQINDCIFSTFLFLFHTSLDPTAGQSRAGTLLVLNRNMNSMIGSLWSLKLKHSIARWGVLKNQYKLSCMENKLSHSLSAQGGQQDLNKQSWLLSTRLFGYGSTPNELLLITYMRLLMFAMFHATNFWSPIIPWRGRFYCLTWSWG